MPTGRLAPPPGASPPMRMTASWSGPQPPYRIQVCGVRYASIASSPSDLIVPPRAQASRRCQTQAPLGGKPPSFATVSLLDPFRALRQPDRKRRDEERLSRSEQKTGFEPKHHLTGKAPYKFESSPLQRRVRVSRNFSLPWLEAGFSRECAGHGRQRIRQRPA